MNLRSARRFSAALCATALFAGSAPPASSLVGADVDTFVVRVRPSAGSARLPGPAEALRNLDVGETFCRAPHCVVLTAARSQVFALRALESRQEIECHVPLNVELRLGEAAG